MTAQQATELAFLYFGLKAQARPLPGEIDQNFHLATGNGEEYILKLAHPDTNPDHLHFQNALLAHLASKQAGPAVPAVIPSREGEQVVTITDEHDRTRYLRLLTWLPGRLWAHTKPHSPDLLHSLGRAAGALTTRLLDFDYPGARRQLKWDVTGLPWIKPHLAVFPQEKAKLLEHFIQMFEKEVTPRLPRLRRSVIHHDANDYNVLVSEDREVPAVTGLLDFGDAIYTHTVNDLAVACAYAIMDKPDPLEAARAVVRGYHTACPLTEEELAALFPLIAARLAISVTVSAINRQAEPDNEYLQVSDRPAWSLLRKLRDIPPAFAHFTFREAGGYEPCPEAPFFADWARRNRAAFAPVVLPDPQTVPTTVLDLNVGSTDLGHNRNFEDIEAFDRTIDRLLTEAGAEIGLGGYGEVRPFYTTDNYLVEGNEGPQWRTVHLGLDVWMPAGSPVCAPWEGWVYSVTDNAGERNYGPTIILEHRPAGGPVFFTLYGHLGRECLTVLRPGQYVAKGEGIATVGPRPENGNWPPHLHFQVMLDALDSTGDYPGVCYPHQRAVWLSLCPDPDLLTGLNTAERKPVRLSAEAILTKRQSHLGPNLSLSYRRPLHIVRAYRQYLYADDARRYLDTVNNVPHVGHQHPRVIEAAQRQMALLNTNTRYLHEGIVRYAEELAATLPDPLSVCYFVNSGSEANELALRMARTVTGHKDMVVIEVGYHGNTVAAVEVSSYKFDGKGGRGAGPHIHVIPIPDPYRGLYRYRSERAGRQYADHARVAIAEVQAAGRGIAGFIGEGILSCGGQVAPPDGYLTEVYRHVRAAGGLCIADEVQTGLGRVGEGFWSFELQGVVPDIVTLGKPIGNGHPLGAVVTTPAIAEAFANGMEYFSTFGGNPVSCAVGREVLKIVQEENLQEHARTTGAYLSEGLRQLQEEHPIIGEVRGPGLFLGFELVRDRKTREPAGREASYLINRMRTHGILMSTDGPHENVIKIKPPMCFNRRNADFLLEKLEKVLDEDFLQENE